MKKKKEKMKEKRGAFKMRKKYNPVYLKAIYGHLQKVRPAAPRCLMLRDPLFFPEVVYLIMTAGLLRGGLKEVIGAFKTMFNDLKVAAGCWVRNNGHPMTTQKIETQTPNGTPVHVIVTMCTMCGYVRDISVKYAGEDPRHGPFQRPKHVTQSLGDRTDAVNSQLEALARLRERLQCDAKKPKERCKSCSCKSPSLQEEGVEHPSE